ncbi:Dynamin-related protein 1E [Hibiscus syriacus]|uniref:Dynamin-related protein 1E n=1 Tax=Hibiscus syriacus TaxID=106335 RepID=A0A6A2XYP9_HIBSY|nr:Dynamin-related protein 1E [Hibiscus syriacus]
MEEELLERNIDYDQSETAGTSLLGIVLIRPVVFGILLVEAARNESVVTVVDLSEPYSKSWNAELVQNLFSVDEAKAILDIPLSQFDNEECRVGEKSSIYSVCSDYQLLWRANTCLCGPSPQFPVHWTSPLDQRAEIDSRVVPFQLLSSFKVIQVVQMLNVDSSLDKIVPIGMEHYRTSPWFFKAGLQHPWVGVVNRSQAGINKNVDMIFARRKEREYFETSPDYGHLASRMGSEYLAKLLSERIPSIISLINKTIDELNAELNRIGRPVAADGAAQLYTILELCRAFDRVFKEPPGWRAREKRPGGDRIFGVFDNQLPAAPKKLPFDRYLSLKSVQKVVTEADGYQPHLIAPEQGYRRLIDGAISYFRGPAEASVDAVVFLLVHFVLKELVRKSIAETQELKRIPTLQTDIATAANEALEKFRDENRKTVLRSVEMESSYLTADFFRKLNAEPEKITGKKSTAEADKNARTESPSGSNVNAYIAMVCDTLRNTIPKAVVYCQVRGAKRSLLSNFYAQVGRGEKGRLSAMLHEDPQLMERRMQLAKRLELYKSARDDIDLVAWK